MSGGGSKETSCVQVRSEGKESGLGRRSMN